MTVDQQNRPLPKGVRLLYWWLVISCVAVSGGETIAIVGWTAWLLLFFASEILLLICLFPRLVRLEELFSRWFTKRFGHDA